MSDPIRVLHVDDDESFGELVAEFLEREHPRFEVVLADSAAAGLERLDRERPDCIISDYEMPGADGIEFLEAVRAEYPKLPFVLFTGKGSEEVASDAITAGATDYLQKQSGTDQYTLLANRVANAVEQFRSQQELERERSRMQFALESTEAAIWTLDIETEEMEIHPTVCPLFGMEIDTFGEFLDQVHPESRSHLRRAVETAARTGEAYSVQFRYVVDGETRWGEMNGRTIREGEAVAFQTGITRDITTQKERKRRFETLTSNLPGMVYRCRNEPGWPMEDVRGNVAAFSGYTAAELEAGDTQWGSDVIHPDDQDEVWTSVQAALDDGESFELTYRIVDADGESRWVWERGRGIYGPQGELEAIEGFITDITERKQREQQLRETNRQFQSVLDTVEAAIFIKDTEGRYQLMNPNCRELFGLDQDADVTGLTDAELMPDTVVERIHEDDQRVLEQGEPVELEEQVPTAHGMETRLTIKSPLYDEDGDLVGLSAVSTDISDRRERERERRRNERRFESMFNDPNILVGLLETDGTVIDINDTAMEYIDVPLEQIVGTPFPETAWWQDDDTDLKRLLERAAAGEYVEYEAEHPTPDGDQFAVEGTIRPVVDDAGDVVSLIISAHDITERRRHEAELETVRDRMEFALERTDSVIWESDPETGSITSYPDPCPLYECSVESTEQFYAGVDELDRPEVEAAFRTAREAGEPQIVEFRTTAEIGTEWIECQIQPFTEDGSVTRLVGVSRDISEYKRRERQLERQNEQFDQLASIVSHDLQTPISAVRGRLELAAETGDLSHVEDARTAVERLDDLRQDLVEMLRSREIVGETEPLAVTELVTTAWERINRPENSTLEVVGTPTVDGDPEATKRLLQNLLSNAVEHADGDIAVRIGPCDGGFYVEDDGPGISPENRDAVFRPGFSTKQGGSGMGMASVEQIVDEHDWTIEVGDAEALDGVRFEITS